ncbi:DNA repair protein RecO [Salinicoccus albus]|uniref:DNA repair protein RecO n=1 Tax=Salinicoccus albus TaxID=418756 RepID=UPI0003673B90|nr:DNA repair protein RecO [Salinicoccus albus]
MIYQQKGVMIRQTNYSESSRIITVLTEEGSQIALMARGFNKTQSPFIVLKQGIKEVLFTYSRFKGMGTLNEVDVVQPFIKLNSNFDLYSHAAYAVEFIMKALDEAHSQESFYRLLIKSLELIESGSQPSGAVAFCAIKMLPYYGAGMNVTECGICGSRDYRNFTHYSFKYHSVVCDQCLNDETGYRSVPIGSRVIYLSNYMKHVPVNKVESIHISEDNAKKLLKFVELIYDEYTGVYFKSRKLVHAGEDT